MSTKKSQYLMLFRDTNWHRELSANEIQEIMGRTNAWLEGMMRDGTMKAGQPLEFEGRTLSFRNGTIADGPFTESKESVGGYVLIEADDFEAAVEIARGNPMIPCGVVVEVRPVANMCPAERISRETAAAAIA
jgi:hypothetical protein